MAILYWLQAAHLGLETYNIYLLQFKRLICYIFIIKFQLLFMDNLMKNKRRFKVQVNAPTAQHPQKHKQLNLSYGGTSLPTTQ